MIKKILISFLFIFIVSCGFQPMLKNIELNSIIVKKINYIGKNELTYLLASNLNLEEKFNSNGYILNLKISENTISAIKNSAGITTHEDYTILVSINVKDNLLKDLINDSLSETKRLVITNNLGTDETTKMNERSKIIFNLSQKLKFKLMILSNR